MNRLIILKNTIAKDKFESTYENIIKNIDYRDVVGFKVSPVDFISSISNFIFTKVCNAYCFSSIRGCFIFKDKTPLNIKDTLVTLLKDFNAKIEIRVSSKKDWYIVYLNDYPSLVYNLRRKKKAYVYSFFLPGSADRPQMSKDSINYMLTMSFPIFEKSFYFNADHILNLIVDSIKKAYPMSIEFIENIEYTLYKTGSFYKNLNSSIKYLKEDSLPFNNTIIDILSKRDYLLNIDHTKDFKLKFTKSKKPSFLLYPIFRGDLIRVIYNINARGIKDTHSCHLLASRLSDILDTSFKVSSYYQKGFDIKDSQFDKYSTLSYGHNTLLEKAIVPKSSIHIYYKEMMYNIQIFDKGMFMIIGSAIADINYKGVEYSGLDFINLLTNELMRDE